MVLRYAIPIGILQADGLLVGHLGFGVSQFGIRARYTNT